jgi:hypothetical protein
MHQYKVLIGIDNPQLLFNGSGTTPELRQGVKGGLGLIDLQLPDKDFLINWQYMRPAPLQIKTIEFARVADYDIIYRISDSPESVESAIKCARNIVGILVNSQEKSCLEEIAKLDQKYPKQAIGARDFHDAAAKLVCDYEINKGRRQA